MINRRLQRVFWHLITSVFYRRQFAHIGEKTVVLKPLQLDETKSIYIEDHVHLSEQGWFIGNNTREETLRIQSGTAIGHFVHIVAKHCVKIENNVLIADKVFISDCSHVYTDVEKPIMEQGVEYLGEVVIGQNSWIGENVCIFGSKIGRNCIIGANSIVNSDIPDYSLAVGCPAKVVKQYNFKTKMWEHI